MSSPTPSTSALPLVENNDTDKISAYYSLAFPNFTYYLQTPTVTIGRRPIPSASSASSSSDSTLIDVDLGPLKSVSRLHARIEYEDEDERFVLVVLGRNGAWVDGNWAPSGSRVPLGARSQIQIATRTFHFILPPPQDLEPTPFSPPSSTARGRSRSSSVDITDLSPDPSRQPSPLAAANAQSVTHKPAGANSKNAKSSKKRKRPEPERPLSEKMPSKPLATYAVMCYRAITSLGGKASLQEVIQWLIDNYEWYRLNVGGPWENSIRHNLSSNRAFCNVAKAGEEKGKGFLWGIDPKSEKMLREQNMKAQQAELDRQNGRPSTLTGAATQPKAHPPAKPVFTKEPLKSPTVKPAVNGASTSKISADRSTSTVFVPPETSASCLKQDVSPVVQFIPASLPSLTPSTPSTVTASPPVLPPVSTSSVTPVLSATVPQPFSSSTPNNVPHSLPIVVAPLPESYDSSATATALVASSASSILSSPPIVVHERKIILSPAMFSHLTPERLRELENMGTQQAMGILQAELKRLLTAKMRSEMRGKGRGKAKVLPPGRATGKSSRKEEIAGSKSKASIGELVNQINATDNQQSDGVDAKQGIRTITTNDEPAAKRQKLDEDAVNMDIDVDIIGT